MIADGPLRLLPFALPCWSSSRPGGVSGPPLPCPLPTGGGTSWGTLPFVSLPLPERGSWLTGSRGPLGACKHTGSRV